MIKEEWRMQTLWINPKLFALFPFLVFAVFVLLFYTTSLTNLFFPGLILLIHLAMMGIGFVSGLINFVRKAVVENLSMYGY